MIYSKIRMYVSTHAGSMTGSTKNSKPTKAMHTQGSNTHAEMNLDLATLPKLA
jgi:hypothetical protein